ncbi:MAG: hypothetical protein ACUVT3_12800, partial [Ignavibacterium sp.]
YKKLQTEKELPTQRRKNFFQNKIFDFPILNILTFTSLVLSKTFVFLFCPYTESHREYTELHG